MNRIILTLLALSFSSTLLVAQTKDLQEFEALLGEKKSAAFNTITESFDNFLLVNYPEIKSENKRIYQFLATFQGGLFADKVWILDHAKEREVLNEFEFSGLRIECWKYAYESYQPQFNLKNVNQPTEDNNNENIDINNLSLEEEIVPISTVKEDAEVDKQQPDNRLSFNTKGLFLYGLTKHSVNDSLIKGYLDVKYSVGDVSPALIAGGLTYNKLDLSSPLRKRVVIVEFYYHFLKWSLEH